MTNQHLTTPDSYFEDFAPGQKMRHIRGKTVGENETVILAAQGHFNSDNMAVSKFGRRITYGGVTASIVVGLASEDTSENALADVAMDKLRLRTPVVEGDTLYSATEVLACMPSDRPDAGLVTFRHYGFNQRDDLVCEVERTVLIRRRPARP
jgi:itaconyl-CoA hydratase